MRSRAAFWIKRSLAFTAGLFVMAMGVSFAVRSDLGVSPVTSVPYALGKVLGVSLGTATFFFYVFCMLLQFAILGREYRLKNLFQIAASFLFGYFTDFTGWLVSFLPQGENIALRAFYLAAGICCVALGILFYLTAAFVSLPTDGTVQAIACRWRLELHRVKIAYDCASTALAAAVSLAFLGGVDGIGVGTLAAAVGVGRMLGIFSRLLKKRLEAFLDGSGDGRGGAGGKEAEEAATGDVRRLGA